MSLCNLKHCIEPAEGHVKYQMVIPLNWYKWEMWGKLMNSGGKEKYFTQKVVNIWNELSEELVKANVVTSFKRYLKSTGIQKI